MKLVVVVVVEVVVGYWWWHSGGGGAGKGSSCNSCRSALGVFNNNILCAVDVKYFCVATTSFTIALLHHLK